MKVFKFISVLILCFVSSCEEARDYKTEFDKYSIAKNDFNPLIKSQVKDFVNTFRKEKFVRDKIVWRGGSENAELKSTNSPLLRGLILLEFGSLEKKVLERQFDAIGPYLERAWINKTYNNIPVDRAIVEVAKDFLDRKYEYQDIVNEGTFGRLNTASHLLRLVTILNPKDILNPNVIKAYPALSLDKILAIVVKSHYLEVRKVFDKFNARFSRTDYPVSACARFKSVSPIMKIDPQWSNEVTKLKSLADEFHKLLDEPLKIYGNVSDHISCLETLEEVLGKNVDPKTGQGLTERYVRYVASNLWDYPLSGKVCAPFGGILSVVPMRLDQTNNFCKNNEKSVLTNLLFLNILERFIANLKITIEISSFVSRPLNYDISKEMELKLIDDLHKLNQVIPEKVASLKNDVSSKKRR